MTKMTITQCIIASYGLFCCVALASYSIPLFLAVVAVSAVLGTYNLQHLQRQALLEQK